MNRVISSFSLLQAIAATLTIAMLLWTFGLPSLRFAEAANVTSVSDTLSDSAPTVAANHTISFITPTGVAEGETVTIDFSDGPFTGTSSVVFTDIDVYDDSSSMTVDAGCTGAEVGASFTGSVLTLEFCAGQGSLPANGTTTVLIGTNAAGGVNRLTNPAAGSYEIVITAGSSDTGATRVAIVPTVEVTASVDTSFTFTVTGVAGGETVNVADITSGPTTATTIPFGQLSQVGGASTTAQELKVITNAANGFIVTVAVDHQLLSSNGADIDGFRNGGYDVTPVDWEGPTVSLGNENTYGHWGLTSDDPTLTATLLADPFDAGGAGGKYASASTTPVEVFRNGGPTNGTLQGVGTTTVGYKAQISALQEAADDYTATLTYVATPVF